MSFESILFLLIATSAFTYSFYRFRILTQLMKNQQGVARPIDQIPKRLKETLIYVFGQKAVLQKKWIGTIHTIIFWGFLIITLGTLEQFSTTLYPLATFEFIGKPLYTVFIFSQDLLTVCVLIAVFLAAYRRYIVKPHYLGQSKDANLILVITSLLMISILCMHSFHILGHHPWYSSAFPISKWLSSGFAQLQLDHSSYATLSHLFKWIHMLLVLSFLVYIPHSKHLHTVAAGPNTFLKALTREQGMQPISFEDESIEQYGAKTISDLSWKDTLDLYSCTECGRCQEVCPAHQTQKPLNPKLLITHLKQNLLQNKEPLLKKQYDSLSPLIDENITQDVIWACTSCRACEIACPVFIQHTDKIYDIRRNLVMMESQFPTEVQTVFKNMETNATPWAFSAADRTQWAQGLDIPLVSENKNVDTLLWVGCAGAFDTRNQKVVQSLARLLKKAGVSFGILGSEEQCTGDSARRIGNEYLFQTLAQSNIETFSRYDVKKIVTACPHCFNTLKNEYPQFGGNYQVSHHSQFLNQLIQEQKLTPSKEVSESITFHDSCYMGRWNGEYQSPRQVLNAIPSTKVIEMEDHHDKSMCCGAGGGRMWMEEKLGTRINITRTEQALKTNSNTIAASCPFCLTMMNDGVKEKEMQDKIQVKDIAEILDESIS